MKHYLWNMLANIKNGQLVKKSLIYQKRKRICESVLKILWDEGFIMGYKVFDNKLTIYLKYTKNGQSVINSLKPLSKPGKRIYYTSKQIFKINSSQSFIIFSTNKGLKTINQCKKMNLGGEPLFCIN